MLANLLRSLWEEPRPVPPAGPAWIDRGLVLLLLPAAVAEAMLRTDLDGRPLAVISGVILVSAVWFRRSHPFGAFVVAFGVAHIATLARHVFNLEPVEMATPAIVLLLPYTLLRWGSGRESAFGIVLMLSTYLLSASMGEIKTLEEAIGGGIIMMFPATLGATMRFRASAQARRVEHAKLKERERLARELHDTVAHYVSAIVIQAQAGQTVASSSPEAASGALATIEEAAGRALGELRSIVGALRDDEAPELAPQASLSDLQHLGETAGLRYPVEVRLEGDYEGVLPSVQATIYRLAQESITNAMNHAKNANRIVVKVVADDKEIHLTVSDDGDPAPTRSSSRQGYGLMGMKERAGLLGGSLVAGPSAHRGWTVQASLPRGGRG